MPESWYGILEALRSDFPAGNPFTASDLAAVAKLRRTERSTADKMAYGWISKFLRWGYVRKAASTTGQSGRRVQGYAVTPNGEACKLMEGIGSKLDRLVAAVRACQKAHGTRTEAGAFTQLVKVCDEVERPQPRDKKA
jgi:hypothetical protein